MNDTFVSIGWWAWRCVVAFIIVRCDHVAQRIHKHIKFAIGCFFLFFCQDFVFAEVDVDPDGGGMVDIVEDDLAVLEKDFEVARVGDVVDETVLAVLDRLDRLSLDRLDVWLEDSLSLEDVEAVFCDDDNIKVDVQKTNQRKSIYH